MSPRLLCDLENKSTSFSVVPKTTILFQSLYVLSKSLCYPVSTVLTVVDRGPGPFLYLGYASRVEELSDCSTFSSGSFLSKFTFPPLVQRENFKKTIDISRVSRLFPPPTFQSSFFSRFCLLLLFSTIYTIISPLILIQRFSINTPNISRPIPFFPLQTPSPLNLRHKPPF